jgi:hypothetical protein
MLITGVRAGMVASVALSLPRNSVGASERFYCDFANGAFHNSRFTVWKLSSPHSCLKGFVL